MLTLIIKQTQFTKELEKAISDDVFRGNTLHIAGLTLMITTIRLNMTYSGENIIEFDYRIPEKLNEHE